MSNSFTDLVKRLNSISNNEETVSGETVYKPVEEAVAGTRETASILKVFNELEEAAKPDYIDLDGDGDKEESMKKAAKDKKAKKESVKEAAANEDSLGDLQSRYRDFIKSEVAQGTDLSTVATTVAETNISAAKLDRAFASTYKVMEQLIELTQEGGKLSGSVIAEGGDESYLTVAHEKIAEAFQALKDAHMYAVKQAEED